MLCVVGRLRLLALVGARGMTPMRSCGPTVSPTIVVSSPLRQIVWLEIRRKEVCCYSAWLLDC